VMKIGVGSGSGFSTVVHRCSQRTQGRHSKICGVFPRRSDRWSSGGPAERRYAWPRLRHSPTALGAYYRQIARRIGADVAVFATARKLATLIYRLLRWGQPYLDEGAEVYEKRDQEMRIKALKSTAKQLGYGLVPNA
jgi:transposase